MTTNKKQATCRHKNAPYWPAEFRSVRCLDCGEWVSLGPSADDSDAVRIEMRAAEMIACCVTSLAATFTGRPSDCRCYDGRRLLRSPQDEATARKLYQEYHDEQRRER